MAKDGQSIQTDFDQKNTSYFWLDIQEPTQDEIKSVEDYSGIKLPSTYKQNGNSINRFFHDSQTYFMTLLTHENKNIVLILKENILITINNLDRTYWGPIQNQIRAAQDAFVFVIEAFIQNITEALEMLEQNTLAVSEKIRHHMKNEIVKRTKHTTKQKIMIMQLNDARDIITNNHSRLVNLRLMLNFLKKCNLQIPEHIEQNINALISHTDFLSNKTSYLHSTVFSYIGITQYNIQSSFNVFSSAFFLPTLIMGFFGMNFPDIPFLSVKNSLYFFIFIAAIGSYLLYQYIKQIQFA